MESYLLFPTGIGVSIPIPPQLALRFTLVYCSTLPSHVRHMKTFADTVRFFHGLTAPAFPYGRLRLAWYK